jgi:hypothetical protein
MFLKFGTQLPYIRFGTQQTSDAPAASPPASSSTVMYHGATQIASAHILVNGVMTEVNLSYLNT